MPDTRQILETIASAIADIAMAKASPLIPSKTLQASMFAEITSEEGLATAIVQIPYYWAVYIHDGRGPFGPTPPRKVLCWFKNPSNDPRTDLGTNFPVRFTDVKRLNREQFYLGLAANRNRRPDDPYMIVTKWQPKTLGPTLFFTQGLAELSGELEVENLVKTKMDEFVATLPSFQEERTLKITL